MWCAKVWSKKFYRACFFNSAYDIISKSYKYCLGAHTNIDWITIKMIFQSEALSNFSELSILVVLILSEFAFCVDPLHIVALGSCITMVFSSILSSAMHFAAEVLHFYPIPWALFVFVLLQPSKLLIRRCHSLLAAKSHLILLGTFFEYIICTSQINTCN